MEKDYVWRDINGNKYTLEEINDRYLFYILRFISNGGGWTDDMSRESITKLFNEANKRKIKHSFKLEDLLNAYYEKLNYIVQVEKLARLYR